MGYSCRGGLVGPVVELFGDEGFVDRRVEKDFRDAVSGVTVAVGIDKVVEACAKVVGERSVEGRLHFGFCETGINDIGGAEASGLAMAKIDDWQAKRSRFDNAAGGVADHGGRTLHEAKIALGAETFDKMKEGLAGGLGLKFLAKFRTSGVGVGSGDDDGLAEGFEECEEIGDDGVDRHRLEGWRVEGEQNGSTDEGEPEVCLQGIRREEGHGEEVIEGESAADVDTPWFLAQLLDALCVNVGRSKMEVAHFADGVAKDVVHRARSEFAAVDVGERSTGEDGSGRSGKHLEAIAEDDNDVGLGLLEGVLHPEESAGVAVSEIFFVGVVVNFCRDGKVVALDFANGVPMGRVEVRAASDQEERAEGARVEAGEQGTENPIVRAGDGDDGDFRH